MSALYMSMSANETDLEIEDDLAKGMAPRSSTTVKRQAATLTQHNSTKDTARPQVQDLVTVEEEFRSREGRPLSRLKNCSSDPKSNGAGRGSTPYRYYAVYRLTALQQNEVASHLEDATDIQEGGFPNDDKTQKYGNLLFLLQSEPRHIAHLCRLVSMSEIDSLLQTVMFTIYGNQYESREEHLLLTMFQVSFIVIVSVSRCHS
jgi:Ras GTPase-activating-like protein IQGAP2/3